MTGHETLDRAGLDRLVEEHRAALLAEVDPEDDSARQAAENDGLTVEGQVREFADAVDRSAVVPVPYERAVVLYGDRGPLLVVGEDAYEREPVYHQTQAGEVRRVVFGGEVVAQLRAI